MCVGGTTLAELFQDTPDESAKESQKKSAQAIAQSAVLLADSVLEILDAKEEEVHTQAAL
jgi:hypothetical protein